MEIFLIGLILIGVGSVVWSWVARRSATWAGWLSALAPLGIFVWLLSQASLVADGQVPSWSLAWVPELGVTLDFRLTGPGLLLAMLITGVGGLILIYGGGYFRGSQQAAPFFGFVQIFMLAMLGVATSDNLLLLFIFWELTSLASYLLIGLSHAQYKARQSALRALLVTGAGGLALLAAILLLGAVGGSFSLAALQEGGEAIRQSPLYLPILVLVILGAFTKSAQVPFHFWLPDAMVAPTPVSAYLHSATMVKAGVFLLAILSPVLGGTPVWHDILTCVGALTMLLGSLLALAQTDLKRLLAYSTMSALGTMVMLLGMGTSLAVTAVMVFLVVHALYKAPLFMIAGVVDKATGTRDIDQLRGLARQMPLLAAVAACAAFSMSGLPPFIGFIGKELLYEAQMHPSPYSYLVTALGFVANAINVTVALKVGISPFLRRGSLPPINPKARSVSLFAGPILLATTGAVVGLFPYLLGERLIQSAVRDLLGEAAPVYLKLWHGFTPILLISFLTLVAGVVLYIQRRRVRALVLGVLHRLPMTASEVFDIGWARGISGAGAVTRFFQHGNLRLYIIVIFAALSVLILGVLVATPWSVGFDPGSLRLVPVGVAVLMAFSAVIALRSQSSVMAILAMGGVGFGVALLFGVFGAPDLALTQILVEMLTLVLFALVIRLLPKIREMSSPVRRRTDALIAIGVGVAVTLALLATSSSPIPQPERISEEMAVRSLPEAHGRNIVNVILVDFRALDTLGEACVLVLASLGVSAMLLGSGRRNVLADRAVATPIFQAASRWVSPLLIFISLVLLIRGHNEPGGGFIGGLVAAAGLLMQRLATARATYHSERRPLLFILTGLVVIVASTLPILIPREIFMQGVWFGSIWLPIVGMTKIGTPFIFDIGIYLVVIGVCLLILTRLLRGETLKHPALGEN